MPLLVLLLDRRIHLDRREEGLTHRELNLSIGYALEHLPPPGVETGACFVHNERNDDATWVWQCISSTSH
jgi:hypothetical protein